MRTLLLLTLPTTDSGLHLGGSCKPGCLPKGGFRLPFPFALIIGIRPGGRAVPFPYLFLNGCVTSRGLVNVYPKLLFLSVAQTIAAWPPGASCWLLSSQQACGHPRCPQLPLGRAPSPASPSKEPFAGAWRLETKSGSKACSCPWGVIASGPCQWPEPGTPRVLCVQSHTRTPPRCPGVAQCRRAPAPAPWGPPQPAHLPHLELTFPTVRNPAVTPTLQGRVCPVLAVAEGCSRTAVRATLTPATAPARSPASCGLPASHPDVAFPRGLLLSSPPRPFRLHCPRGTYSTPVLHMNF